MASIFLNSDCGVFTVLHLNRLAMTGPQAPH